MQKPGCRSVQFRIIAAAWASLAVLMASGGARAQDHTTLYTAKAVVTGKSEKNRIPGFADCLRRVVVKVSGDQRLLDEPGFEDLLANAGELVASFSYRDRLEGIPIHDEQGTYDRPHDLTCVYEPETLDPVLASLGSRPWLTERPRLAVFLAVQDQKRQFVLARDGDESPYMVESFEAAAAPMAMSIAIPDAADLQRYGLVFEEVHAASPEIWENITESIGGEAPLIGSLRWSDADLGWIAHWRLYFESRTYEWTVRGVNFDEAFRVAMRGAAQALSGNGEPE